MNSLVQVGAVKAIVVVSQRVMHLSCALRITNVRNLVLTSCFLNGLDVCFVIIETHLAPVEVPVIVVRGGIESLVTPTIFSTTVVTHPDVKARVNEFKGEVKLITVSRNPLSSILTESVLYEDSTFCGSDRLSRLSRDMESRQDVVVFGRDCHWLPVVPVLFHSGSEPWV